MQSSHDVTMSEIPQTIPEMLAATVASRADQDALATVVDDQLQWRTWAEVDAAVQHLAQAMLTAGIQHGDRIIQCAPNSYEWIITDLAIHVIGGVHVPLHTSLAEAQIVDQIADCGAQLAFFSADVFEKVADKVNSNLKTVYYGNPSNAEQQASNAAVASLEQFLERATGNLEPTSPQPDDLATLLYTSGTTGQPRGVMLNHRNIATNTIATTKTVDFTSEDRRVCFLPLSHIYARTCDLYSWLYMGSQFVVAESRDTIIRDCQIAKPDFINGVPYFYQKVAPLPGLKELLGGNIRCCFCGGAALAPETEQLLTDQGIAILPGYGLTESSPVISLSTFENYRPGTVGRPIQGVEVRIDDSGEILARGPNIMQGYWQNEAATAEAIIDGWLYTGDLGEFDEAGNLRIIGRKKEIIVLMTGKNVSPTTVEQRLTASPFIENACVIGSERKCLSALIIPNTGALDGELQSRQQTMPAEADLAEDSQVREIYRQEIDRVLADLSHEEQVGLFLILARPFSVETGELTAKLSLRRKVIENNYTEQIEALYR